MATTEDTLPHYREPSWFTRRVFNRLVLGLTRLGLSIRGSRILEVPGRTTGRIQRVPVNLLHLDGRDFLVSPRGEGHWVRNVRAARGSLDLLLGRHRDHLLARELPEGEEKLAVIRAYLERWDFEVGVFFDGLGAGSSEADLALEAPKHPVFLLDRAT
jgi:hypothetical protein